MNPEIGPADIRYVLRNDELLALTGMRRRNNTERASLDNCYQYAWEDFYDRVCTILGTAFESKYSEGFNIYEFHLPTRQQQMLEQLDGRPTISMDSMLYAPNVHHLGLSRRFYPRATTAVGVFERPGFPPIEEQIEDFSDMFGNKEVCLADDDAASGTTIKKAHAALRSGGVNVAEIHLGMQFGDHEFEAPVYPLVKFPSFDAKDPIEDIVDVRNFLLGSRKGGAVILFPDGTEGRWLYTPPLVWPPAQTTIPDSSVTQFSREILEANLVFFENVHEHTGKPICLQDGSLSSWIAVNHLYPGDFTGDTPLQEVCRRVYYDVERMDLRSIDSLPALERFNHIDMRSSTLYQYTR